MDDELSEQDVSGALCDEALRLAAAGCSQEALGMLDRAIVRQANVSGFPSGLQLAKLLLTKGYVLDSMGESRAALVAFEDATSSIRPPRDLIAQRVLVCAHHGAIGSLVQLKRHDEAIRRCDGLVDLFAGSPDLKIRESIAKLL